jgi:hypothetical protein
MMGRFLSQAKLISHGDGAMTAHRTIPSINPQYLAPSSGEDLSIFRLLANTASLSINV